jgi:phosphocarrier protein
MKRGADGAMVLERRVRVCNQRGLHARASAKFVRLADTFPCRITVTKEGMEVAGTSIMGLLLLAAAAGEELILRANGQRAEEAMDALEDLICNRFEERA